MKTRMGLIVGGVVVGVLLIVYFVGGFSGRVKVEAARAKRGPIKEFIDEQAVTRLPDTHLITMPAAGRIGAITLHEGSPVKKGQVVARIVPRDLDLAVQQATASVQRLEASIKENADNHVEETAHQQAQRFVESTQETVKAAKARTEAGRAKYQYAEKNFGRVQRLAASKTRTQDDLDLAELQMVQGGLDYYQDRLVHAAMVAMAAATDLMPTMVRQYIDRKVLTGEVLVKQKAEAEFRLQQILQEQERGTMQSPVDGVVLARPISNERFLAAGAVLLEIGRLEDLEVEADVLSLDVVAAEVGDPVEIYGPAIGRPSVYGTVVRIFPAGFTKLSSLGVEQQRVKVIVRMDAKDLKRLLDQRNLGVGYRVRVRIFTADKPNALTVPRSALFRDPAGNWQVYAIRQGRAQIQTVEVGLMNDQSVEVTSGLAEDEQVILAPESTLAEGTRVAAEEK